MPFEYQKPQEEGGEKLRTKYEPLLWQRADELAEERQEIEERHNALYEEAASLRAGRLGPFEKETLGEKEKEYWELEAKIRDIKGQENAVEEALLGLADGKINEEDLKNILPEQTGEEKQKVSKRKQRILEQKERDRQNAERWGVLGMEDNPLLPKEDSMFIHKPLGANPTQITTGQKRKNLKGSIDPGEAEGLFYEQTKDTHGGKSGRHVEDAYIDPKSGKRIRKK